MSGGTHIIKSGFLDKYSKGAFSDKWKRAWVTLYSDSSIFWFKNKSDSTSKGNAILKDVCRYLTVGARCREVHYSPEQLPTGTKLENMIAFPQQPKKKSQWNFFVCSTDQEMSEWMTQISSTLPQAPQQQGMAPGPPQAPGAPAYGQAPSAPPHHGAPGGPTPIVPQTAPMVHAGMPQPIVPQHAAVQHTRPPSAGGALGFEGMAGGGQPPQYSPYPPAAGGYPQPPAAGGYPQPPAAGGYPQPPAAGGYRPPPVPGGYAPPPAPGGYGPPPVPHGGQPYGQPQQPYPQQPGYHAQPYPQQPQYPRQQYQQPYQQGYQGQPQQGYYQQQRPQGAYGAQPQQQTIIIKEKKHKGGSGNMAAGLVGGALAGYAAGRVLGGPHYGYGYGGYGGYGGYHCGPGFGWGHGSWSSGSWGSWSSCGSFGSFGSFD